MRVVEAATSCQAQASNGGRRWAERCKAATDLVVAATLVLVLLPVLLLVALAIILDSPGPVLFTQPRVGRRGRPFRLVKFRSMHVEADALLFQALAADPEMRDDWSRYRKLKKGDPRVTRVGRVLRRASIDELPQLCNVLRGEMSLVGPRPYLPEELDMTDPRAQVVCRLRPGITGVWQTSGRNELSFEDRIRMDEAYIRGWTFGWDLSILARTFRAIVRREGAY